MRRFIGDKEFYKKILLVAVPIMIQNGITNFVNLLDNIMVGQVGTEQMSGVAIVNQLLFVFNITIFGIVSGASIFSSQFYGCGDHKGVRDAFRFKLLVGVLLGIIGIVAFTFYGDNLINLYLHEEGAAGEAALRHGRSYLWIMLVGLLPYAIEQAYASTLRETGETLLPMKAGVAAVCINLVLNYLLIFGKFGFPQLGVQGAAVATVIARFTEMGIVIIWTHAHKARNIFIQGAYRGFRIPAYLVEQIFIKGTPLMINEALWAAGTAFLNQCYSRRGLAVVAATNISSTISNVFNVVFIALGSAISIIVGQLLGAGKMEEAKDTDRKMIFFSVASCVVIGLVMAAAAPLFPGMYNTSEDVKELATSFIVISALCMPLYAFMHAAYFTLRSGGKTIVTFLFDSVFMWVVSIPFVLALVSLTNLPIVTIYLFCQLIEIIKCIIGFILVKKGIWIQNIVAGQDRK